MPPDAGSGLGTPRAHGARVLTVAELMEQAGIVGSSPALLGVLEQVIGLAPLEGHVRVEAPTGAGKELIARAIWHATAAALGRPKAPFVVVNCARLERDLADSELFGHVRGAFTGAANSRAGAIRRADGGVLFCDEAAELPFESQAKLLRVIEDGVVRPVGSEEEHEVRFRAVFATNRPLLALVEQGIWREDLFCRVPFWLELPGLAERPEDVAPIARAFAARFGLELADDAVAELCRRDLPGNARDLRNAILRAAAAARGRKLLTAADLPPSVARTLRTRSENATDRSENATDRSENATDRSENATESVARTLRTRSENATDRSENATESVASTTPLRWLRAEIARHGVCAVAREARMDHNAVSRYASGKRVPSALVLEKLVRALGRELTVTVPGTR